VTPKRLIPLIHVGCRELGLSADDRKAMQLRVVGKDSLGEMTGRELEQVLDHLKASGFKPVSKGRKSRNRAPRADLRLVHVLWGKLGEAGALRDPSRAGLYAFIRARFGDAWSAMPLDVDALRDWQQIDDVIQALKSWGQREVIDFDWGDHRK